MIVPIDAGVVVCSERHVGGACIVRYKTLIGGGCGCWKIIRMKLLKGLDPDVVAGRVGKTLIGRECGCWKIIPGRQCCWTLLLIVPVDRKEHRSEEDTSSIGKDVDPDVDWKGWKGRQLDPDVVAGRGLDPSSIGRDVDWKDVDRKGMGC